MTPVVRKSLPPPAPIHNARDYGAKGDGVTNDTEALRKAIAACAGTGGSVLLDKGVFVAADLELKSRMTLYIAKGATLRSSDNPKDFPVHKPSKPEGTCGWSACVRSLLFAENVENLAIDGGGMLDGNGRGLHKNGMNRTAREGTRPCTLRIFNGKNITVRNVDFYNSHMWTENYDNCENLLIEQLRVIAMPDGGDSYNSDGMNICNSRHVVIRDNDLDAPDDIICFKSHGPGKGIEDVLVTNNTIRARVANGIKFGTSTAGPIRNVRFINNHIVKAGLGGFCIESVDGSNISDIRVKGLTIEDTMHPFFIRLAYRGAYWEIAPSVYPKEIGTISGVTIENVVVKPTKRALTGPKWGNGWREPSCTVTGVTKKNLGDILFKDIRVVMPGGIDAEIADPKENDKAYPQSSIFGRIPASVFFVRHADKVRFENIEVGTAKPDSRPWLRAVDAKVESEGVKELGVVTPGK